MKLWPWRRKQRITAGAVELAAAEQARLQSERALQAARRLSPAVAELAQALAARREINHFAASIQTEWRRHR